jgi:hypothetical protein
MHDKAHKFMMERGWRIVYEKKMTGGQINNVKIA